MDRLVQKPGWWLSLLFCFMPYVSWSTAYHLSSITLQDIEQAYKHVSFQMKKNTALRVGFLASTIGITCSGMYYFFQAGPLPTSSVPEISLEKFDQQKSVHTLIKIENLIPRIEKALQENNENNIAMKQSLVENGYWVSNASWGSTWKYWKHVLGQTTLTIILSTIITGGLGPIGKYFKKFDAWVDSTVARLFHERTISWFIATQTHIFDLLNVVKKDLLDKSIERIMISWELFKKDIAHILGFITYQKLTINQSQKHIMQRFDQIIQKINVAFENARNGLMEHARESSSVHIIESLKDDLDNALQECALIESLVA